MNDKKVDESFGILLMLSSESSLTTKGSFHKGVR